MWRKFILLSILFSCMPVLVALYEINEYYNYNDFKNKKILKIKKENDDLEQKVTDEEKKIENVKAEQAEKVEILEVWQRRLEKLK